MATVEGRAEMASLVDASRECRPSIGEQGVLGEHGPGAQGDVIGQAHPDGRQCHDPDDGQSSRRPTGAHHHGVPHVFAELAQGRRPELDLVGDPLGRGPEAVTLGRVEGAPADGGRLHGTAVGSQSEHGHRLTVDEELGEAERRPSGHPVLRLHQPVETSPSPPWNEAGFAEVTKVP